MGACGLVELKGMPSLGGAHGASVTMDMTSSNTATSVTLFLASTDTLNIPKLLYERYWYKQFEKMRTQ